MSAPVRDPDPGAQPFHETRPLDEMRPLHEAVEEAEDAVRALLRAAGAEGDAALTPLRGGANNRVYRVDCGGRRFLLKRYYRPVCGGRDRLASDFAFCAFARRAGLDAAPAPLARDAERGMALYEYIEGRPLEPREIGDEAVGAALDFFLALNRCRSLPEAQGLPLGAEAFFSLEGHAGCVRGRLDALCRMDSGTPLQAEAKDFVRNALEPAGRRVIEALRGEAVKRPYGGTRDLAQGPEGGDRCLSPSDFGFHNALRERGGRLRFFDFEYAGWDDPAKAVCDFFCQPALPVPQRSREAFSLGVASLFRDREFHLRRFRLLLPLFQVKWCCIMLNPFLREGSRRRAFALEDNALKDGDGGDDGKLEEHRLLQLGKAKELYGRIGCV